MKYDNRFSNFKFQLKNNQLNIYIYYYCYYFLDEILNFEKFESVDFKYDNSISKFQPKKILNNVFLVPNLRFLA